MILRWFYFIIIIKMYGCSLRGHGIKSLLHCLGLGARDLTARDLTPRVAFGPHEAKLPSQQCFIVKMLVMLYTSGPVLS